MQELQTCQKKHIISNSKHNAKKSGKDDLKNALSNLQHKNHRITTTNDTF